MTEQERRDDMARTFGWELIDDDVWNDLDSDLRDGTIANKNGEAEARKGLISQLQGRRRSAAGFSRMLGSTAPELSRVGASNTTQSMIRLDREKPKKAPEMNAAADTNKNQAFSMLLAAEAAENPTVVKFRREFLGDRLLDEHGLRTYLGSAANRCLTRQQLNDHEISTVDHQGYPVECDAEAVEVLSRVGQAAETASATYPEVDEVDDPQVAIRVRTSQSAIALYRSVKLTVNILGCYLPDSFEEGASFFFGVEVFEGSVLDEVTAVAKELVSENYPWNTPQATTFLLTGWPPNVNLVNSSLEFAYRRDHRFARILLEIAPWTTPETVLNRFMEEQKHLLRTRNRSFSDKTLTLIRFVAGRNHGASLRGEALPTWKEHKVKWDQEYGDWKYDTPEAMGNDYRRARKRLLFYPSAQPEDFDPIEPLLQTNQPHL